jgi:hypothetical protein
MNDPHLLIHRSPTKWDFYNSLQPIFWSDELKCWITCDVGTLVSVLKDRNFTVINYKKETANISQALGVDFRTTEKLLEHVPFAHEGKCHAALRKDMAVEISERTNAALGEFTRFCNARVSVLVDAPASFNIVSELFAPCVFHLMSSLSGVCLETPESVSPTQVFDRSLSVNRRKQIDRQIGKIFELAGSSFPAEAAGLRSAMLVLGSDSLLGSLSESFCYEIGRNTAKRMNEISWEPKIPVTAVPYVERMAVKGQKIGEVTILENQRIRLYLDVFSSQGSDGFDHYFGTGRHGCLGKAISQKAWQILTSELGRIEKKIRINKVEYRSADYLFNFPSVIDVSVQDG